MVGVNESILSDCTGRVGGLRWAFGESYTLRHTRLSTQHIALCVTRASPSRGREVQVAVCGSSGNDTETEGNLRMIIPYGVRCLRCRLAWFGYSDARRRAAGNRGARLGSGRADSEVSPGVWRISAPTATNH